jgi:hypothetical protein
MVMLNLPLSSPVLRLAGHQRTSGAVREAGLGVAAQGPDWRQLLRIRARMRDAAVKPAVDENMFQALDDAVRSWLLRNRAGYRAPQAKAVR